MPENPVVVGLDVGTTKICVLVGDVDPSGAVRLLGMGQADSFGLRKGVVVDISATGQNIRDAIHRASENTGIDITSVVVGVTGGHVTSSNCRGTTSITHSSREITESDVHRVLESARTAPVPSGREVIHVLPRGFTVDGQAGVRRPVGMSGCRLEVDTHVITGSSTCLQNVFKSVEQAGLHVDEFVLEPLATVEAVLTPSEKELGVLVADIGGGTTDLAIVNDGAIVHSAVLPVGGNHVTYDLTVGLKTSREDAERLKRDFGCALSSMVADDDLVDVPTAGGSSSYQVTRRAIADIIEPRMQELYELIRRELKQSGCEQTLSTMVLSGGGSLLHGAPELAFSMLGLPARVGRPRGLSAPGIELDSPAFATAAGLLYFAAARHARTAREETTQHFLLTTWEHIKQWVSHILGG